ncbi:MAG: hypothetical protein NTY08_10830 [Proteobacteria bacterium]|nr:hypothetical protein [Pseudomonadota bacterium]
MNLVSNKIVSTVRTVLASTAVMFAMSDLGNGHVVVYDNDGNIVHEEWK